MADDLSDSMSFAPTSPAAEADAVYSPEQPRSPSGWYHVTRFSIDSPSAETGVADELDPSVDGNCLFPQDQSTLLGSLLWS